MSFDRLGLSPELLRAVAQQGYTEPTPVQPQAIPLVLAGRDVLAGAQTGTGKTAAFVLPMLQRLHASRPSRPARHPRADPHPDPRARAPGRGERPDVRQRRTRSARRPSTAASASTRRSAPCAPGRRSSSRRPGRLLDHLGQRTIDLSRVEILVLDEADRMLDMGFIRDIRKILAVLPPRRQNLLFSATFSDEIRRLADGLLDDPASVQVTPRNTADRARHPGRPHGRPRAQARAAQPPHHGPAGSTRRSSSPAPSTAPTGSPCSSEHDGIAGDRHPRQQEPAAARPRAGRLQGRAGSRSSSRPRSPPAASTSRRSRTSSTSSCRWSPRTTSTGSAGPAGRASTATPSRSSASTSSSCSTTSSGCSAAASRARRSRASSPIRASGRSRSCAAGSAAHGRRPDQVAGRRGMPAQPRHCGAGHHAGAPRAARPQHAGARPTTPGAPSGGRRSAPPAASGRSSGRAMRSQAGRAAPGSPARDGRARASATASGRAGRRVVSDPVRGPAASARRVQRSRRRTAPRPDRPVMPGERLARHGGSAAGLIRRVDRHAKGPQRPFAAGPSPCRGGRDAGLCGVAIRSG